MKPWLTVIVATCGDPYWIHAGDQAAATIPEGAHVVRIHEPDGTVASARNAGLRQAPTKYVTWLDADDSLTPDYLDAMAGSDADIRQPAIDGWSTSIAAPTCGHHGPVHTARRECLAYGNPLSMGAVVRTDLAKAHPFDERWPVLEDFAFWRSICADPNVTVEVVERAVYRARTRRNPNPRNRSMPREEWKQVADAIADAIPFPLPGPPR